MIRILVYPKFNNPYQELLYSSLFKRNIKIQYLDHKKILFIPFKLLFYRLRGYKIFHLHWQHFETHLKFKPLKKILNTIYAILFIYLIKILQYKLVWTIHNLIPHENQTINDKYLSKFISDNSDAKIIHALNTKQSLKKLHCHLNNIYLIPHGSFKNYYPNNTNKKSSRKQLGLKQDAFIYLYFGMIRKYKNVDILLKNFNDLLGKYPASKLQIAGKCYNHELKKVILRYKRKLPNSIYIKLDYISDNKIQLYFNASDIIVLPYSNVTTSGTSILALSFKKPIIYPEIGNLNEMPKNIGFSYNINSKKGIYDAMTKAIINKKHLRSLGQNGLKYAESISWDKIADETKNVYQNLLK